MNIFETATRKKYRFPFRGQISVEDLWDLSLTDLDTVYKTLMARLKAEENEDSLMAEQKDNTDLKNGIEIVRKIYAVRKAEIDRRKAEAENARKKERLLEILAKKQDNALEDKTEEEILQMLKDLDGSND